MTGEGLGVGKVWILCSLSHLGPFCLQVNSLNWIFYHSSLGKDELALNGGGSCAVYLVLAPSVSFCFQVNSLTKTMFFCIELNRIGRSYQLGQEGPLPGQKIRVIFEQDHYQHLLSFLFLLYPHSTCWLSREIREILSRFSWLNSQRSIAGVLEIKRLWSRSNPFTTLNGRSSCKVFSNILQRAFNLEKLQIEMHTKTRTNSFKIEISKIRRKGESRSRRGILYLGIWNSGRGRNLSYF